MQKIKSEKGITTIALVITIIIIAVISVPIAVKTSHLQQVKKFTNLRDDLTRLEESISTLYGPDEDISAIGPVYADINTEQPAFLTAAQGSEIVANPNDNSKYYIINAKKLDRDLNQSTFGMRLATLNYGKNSYNVESGERTDVYIINEKSRTIYYPDGVKYGDTTYYRLPESYTGVN